MTIERPFVIRIRIRDLRKEQSLTQEDLAELLGVSRQSVIALESGKYMPSLPLAMQLADVFRLPLDQIFSNNNPALADCLPTGYPPMNLALAEGVLLLEAAVTGYLRDEISIDISAESVTIIGQPGSSAAESKQYLAQELLVLPFKRTLRLPYQVDPDHCTAAVKNGMLTITMPLKPQSSAQRRLTISHEG